jgi:hypothetical protein
MLMVPLPPVVASAPRHLDETVHRNVRLVRHITFPAARASARYDTKALWTLTVAIGQMCFWIPVALIAKPIVGQEPHWSK